MINNLNNKEFEYDDSVSYSNTRGQRGSGLSHFSRLYAPAERKTGEKTMTPKEGA